MSTNYYVNEPVCQCPCPHCTAEEHPHIGKHSGGWEFMFSAVHGPRSWAEWKQYLQGGKSVINEYDEVIETEKFIRLVEATRNPNTKNQGQYLLSQYLNKYGGSYRAGMKEFLEKDIFFDEEGWAFWLTEFS